MPAKKKSTSKKASKKKASTKKAARKKAVSNEAAWKKSARKTTTRKKTAAAKPAGELKTLGFPVVGIGASAGGLEAIGDLLKYLPSDIGMAFVLVQHLAPEHKSMMAELLTQETKLKVAEIKDGMPIEPDHLYVIPPNTNLAILNNTLHLMPREVGKHHLPIDYFFQTLAEGAITRLVSSSPAAPRMAQASKASKKWLETAREPFSQDPVRGRGGRTRVGNACLYVLGQMPGLSSVTLLSALLQKIKYPSARRLVEKALDAAAERNNMSRDELVEISVPDFGLDAQGELHKPLGDVTAALRIEPGQKVSLLWQKADGKLQKTVPAAVKDAYADDIQALKKSAKEMRTTLQAQVARIEGCFLKPEPWTTASGVNVTATIPCYGRSATS